jgi:DNA repair exonuclease SbcCD ATPase subunit
MPRKRPSQQNKIEHLETESQKFETNREPENSMSTEELLQSKETLERQLTDKLRKVTELRAHLEELKKPSYQQQMNSNVVSETQQLERKLNELKQKNKEATEFISKAEKIKKNLTCLVKENDSIQKKLDNCLAERKQLEEKLKSAPPDLGDQEIEQLQKKKETLLSLLKAVQQRGKLEAEHKRQEAERQYQEAERQRQEAEHQHQEAERQRLEALYHSADPLLKRAVLTAPSFVPGNAEHQSTPSPNVLSLTPSPPPFLNALLPDFTIPINEKSLILCPNITQSRYIKS